MLHVSLFHVSLYSNRHCAQGEKNKNARGINLEWEVNVQTAFVYKTGGSSYTEKKSPNFFVSDNSTWWEFEEYLKQQKVSKNPS